MPFSKQLEKIKQGKLWKFSGGIHPLGRKNTTDTAIQDIGIPSLITLPLDRHLGDGGELLVSLGEKVKAGQPLTAPGGSRNVPLHASTSGEIVAISQQMLTHPSGFTGRCITIKTDGLDEALPPQPMNDWRERPAKDILQRIRDFGVEGLGGAQFQTAAKIEAALEESSGDCNIFIVNGCECEPVVTCDDRLMQERAEDIAQGIEIVRHLLKPQAIIVAIEDNKPHAIEAMKKAVAPDVMVRVLPTLYPSGAARNLIRLCTGIEIPYKAHTSECGIVVDNVETVFAIKQAVIDGLPLIKRIITVDGQTLGKRGNAYVRLGTSVRYVLNSFHLNPERRQRIIAGGPFMGFTLPSIDVPITKATACIFVPSAKELPKKCDPMNCIRCGRCARVCPSRLVPYQLYAMSKAGQHKNTKREGMMDCTECGCCSYVCPSHIALTAQFRKEKATLRLLDEQQRRNAHAKERMNERQARLDKEAKAREKRREAALARAAAQKESEKNLSPAELAEKRAIAAAAAKARAAARRLEHAGAMAATSVSARVSGGASPIAPADQGSAAPITGIHAPTGETLQEQQSAPAAPQRPRDPAAARAAAMKARAARRLQQQQAAAGGAEVEQPSKAASTTAPAYTKATTTPVADPLKPKELIPQSLRRASTEKHAAPIKIYPEMKDETKDLKKVENPPAEGVIIPESKPRTRSYLHAPEETEKKQVLPSHLKIGASPVIQPLVETELPAEPDVPATPAMVGSEPQPTTATKTQQM